MRKLLIGLVLALTFSNLPAQYVTLPDTLFRNDLKANYPGCFNAQGQMDTTCSAIVNATWLNLWSPGISDLDGVQYFKSLQHLQCTGTQLGHLPALPNTLLELNLSNNQLHQLPTLPASLQRLEVTSNSLTTLPPLPASLKYLVCRWNHLTVLPALPASLVTLQVDGNNLAALPALNPGLEIVVASDNALTSLPALPASLGGLEVFNNQLTALPALPQGLGRLLVGTNHLTSLPSLPASLSTFDCSNNPLTGLPPLPSSLQFLGVSNIVGGAPWLSGTTLPNLLSLFCEGDSLTALPTLPASVTDLVCGRNKLTGLPALNRAMTRLSCNNNLLTSLPRLPDSLFMLDVNGNDLFCLPVLPAKLQYLTIDDSKITCLPNSGSNLQVTGMHSGQVFQHFPICTATNNVHNCHAFPVMKGRVFFDFNNNGVKDAAEPYANYRRVALSNGSYCFTDNNGYYELGADTLGTYVVKPAPPVFFKTVPDSIRYQFSTNDTVVLKDFALQPNVIKDSVSVSVTSLSSRARPGFAFDYLVNYSNAGSTNLSATTVSLQFNDTLLTYLSASDPSLAHSGNILSLSLPALPYGSSGYFVAHFNVKITAPLGNPVNALATITNALALNNDQASAVVSGAFDPNDKTATPSFSTTQLSQNQDIEYTIRFQNTGTDTAFTVIVTDTLSSQLRANTVQLVSTSHSCQTTVKGNVVTFEMRNILLPDKNTNEPASHGFVKFRVKPVTTLTVGNTVNNQAAIYFDFNTPVMTNSAVTHIVTPNVVLQLLSLQGERGSFTVLRNPVRNELLLTDVSTALFKTTGVLYNNSGVEVKRFLFRASTQTLNVQDLPPGVYYLNTAAGTTKLLILR